MSGSRGNSRERAVASSSAIDIQMKSHNTAVKKSAEVDAERELSQVLNSSMDNQSAMLNHSSSMVPGALASQIYNKLSYVQRRS